MKPHCLACLAVLPIAWSALGQGYLVVNPVPVTNGLSGVLADSSIVAALYYGPGGTTDSLVPVTAPTPLVGGYAQFSPQVLIPGLIPGVPVTLQIKAWSGGFTSYDEALASGVPSVLTGQSDFATAIVGGSPAPPPVPPVLTIPGFTINAVPEVSTRVLFLSGVGLLFLRLMLKGRRNRMG